MQLADDLERLKSEYTDRKERIERGGVYSHFNPAFLYAWQQRERQVLRLLRANGFADLSNTDVLEVGTGTGSVLLQFLSYDADPRRLHGIDLMTHRLEYAHRRMPHSTFLCADGEYLPYPSASFDLLLQFTAFSSILSDTVKQNMAREMLRLLRPGGMILWYDMWLNPRNKHIKGIAPAEIRALFPNCTYTFQKATLAPPLAKRLAPIAWPAAALVEALKVFNSHYLAAIRPNPKDNPNR